MEEESGQPVRLGVIGLGPNWRRYRRALRRERQRFRVSLVFDEIAATAARQAKRLRCRAAESVSQLLNSSEVDAVLLADEQWYRLWPLERAAEAGKPILCVPLPAADPRWLADPEHAARQFEQLEAAGARVLFQSRLRHSPASRRLKRLFETALGSPRTLVCLLRQSAPVDHGPFPTLAEAIDWCIDLLGKPPTKIETTSSPPAAVGRISNFMLQFPAQRVAQLSVVVSGTDRGRPDVTSLRVRADVVTERGEAELQLPQALARTEIVEEYRLPESIRWTAGQHARMERYHHRHSLERRLLRRLHDLVHGKPPSAAGLREMRLVLDVVRAAAQSEKESRSIELDLGK